MLKTTILRQLIIILLLIKLKKCDKEVEGAPLLPSNVNNDDNFELLILHTNDMHARFAETSQLSGTCYKQPCYGGFGRVSTIFKEARMNATSGQGPKNVLILNAGDTYTGSVYFTLYRSNISTEMINSLDFDVLSLGNHEFDDGIRGLLPFIEGVKRPIVCANINTTNEPKLAKSKLQRSVIIDVNGMKVGIIGYLTNETIYLSKTENTQFVSEVDAIRLESEKLNKEGVQILIALGHSGFDIDREIAKNVPLIDIVVGGHSNTFLYTGKQPDIEVPDGVYPTIIKQSSGKNVPVVQAYAYTKYVGKLFVKINPQGDVIESFGNPILVTNEIPKDKTVEDVLDKYRPGVEKLKRQVIGQTKVLLDGRFCRTEECNIGNLIADSFVHYHMTQYYGTYWTDTPIGIINGGGIRTSIDGRNTNGNITVEDLITTLPFGNMIQSTTLTGEELWSVFEHSAKQHELGGFLQVSGLYIVYDFSDSNDKKVESIKVRCGSCLVPEYENLVLNKTYKMLLISFTSDGGDGYNMFVGKNYINEGIDDVTIVTEYFQKFSPILNGLEERIIIKSASNIVEDGTTANSTPYFLVTIILGILSIILIGIICYIVFFRKTRREFGLT